MAAGRWKAVVSGKTEATVKTKPRGLACVTGGATAAVRAIGLLGGMLTYAREVGYRNTIPLGASASRATSAAHSDLRRKDIASVDHSTSFELPLPIRAFFLR